MGNKASRSGGILGNKISAKDYEVYLDSIARVVNQGADTNYTFALEVKGSGPNEFYNLVVGKTPDGGIKDPIVVRYILDQADMDYFMNGGTDLKRLNATYRYYNFERFFNEDLKLSASGTGDCGSGYVGGGSGGGPTVPPGGSIQTSGFGITSTTTFQTGGVTSVPYNFNISVTDANGNTEVSTGYSTSQNLSSTFSTTYGQGDAQVSTYPPTTATINQDTRATQDQSGTISGGCMSSSYLDGAGWQINGCESLGTGDGNKGSLTAKEGDCNVPEGTMATLTTFTLMILNKTSGYIDLNLSVPVDWSRYLWLSYRVIPVCIPINQFVEGNGQSSEAKKFANLAQIAMMSGIEIPPSCKSFKYQQGLENIQTAAVKNISFRVRYIDPNTGNPMTSDVVFTQPIYFTIPRFHSTEGNLTTGRGAELSARALLSAHSRATAYFLATEASESQVRAQLWEYIRDEFSNGSYMTGGGASFTPPLGGFDGPITNYITTTFFMDNCD